MSKTLRETMHSLMDEERFTKDMVTATELQLGQARVEVKEVRATEERLQKRIKDLQMRLDTAQVQLTIKVCDAHYVLLHYYTYLFCFTAKKHAIAYSTYMAISIFKILVNYVSIYNCCKALDYF